MSARDERGFTLVELLAAMLVGGVVLLALFGLVDLSTRQHAVTVDRVETMQRARLGVDLIGQRLRLAVCPGTTDEVFVATTDTEVTFHAQQSARPTGPSVTDPPLQRRTIALAGTRVEERVHDLDLTQPGTVWRATPTRTTTLVQDVRAPAGTPFFEYRSAGASTQATEAERRSAGQVVVRLEAIPRRADDELATRFESTVAIRSDDPTSKDIKNSCA